MTSLKIMTEQRFCEAFKKKSMLEKTLQYSIDNCGVDNSEIVRELFFTPFLYPKDDGYNHTIQAYYKLFK